MIGLEFWIVTVTDEDGDMHGSEIVWGDGMCAADALEQFRSMSGGLPSDYYPEGCDIVAHGPYQTNGEAA